MKHVPPRSLPLLTFVALVAACNSGGGGGAVPQATTAALSGSLRVPQVAPQVAGAALDVDMTTLDVDQPMVPGEVVVWMAPGHDATTLQAAGCDLVRAGVGRTAVFHARAAEGRSSLRDGAALADSVEKATCDAAARIKQMPGVLCASPNYLLQAYTNPDDPFFDKQWHLRQINLPQTWDLTQGSSSVIVAVLDTGIVSAHPEFTGRLIAGFDMISNPQVSGDGDGRDPDPEDVGDQITPQGSSFHGTHVAGTIGANGDDGVGVAGVDWNCKIMPVRVLGRGGGTIDDIANGILFAARLPNASGQLPAQRADIINMSLGGPGLNPVLEAACNQAAAAGVLLVAAAGNDNSDQPSSPAAFASVLSVGAVDLVRQRAPYSNFSPTVDLWAPGGDMSSDKNGDTFPDGVLSAMADDQGNLFWKFENGTSMASPHVAGVAALVKAADPSLTAAQIRDILIGSATAGLGLPNSGRLIDALAAVQAAQGGGGASGPVLVATPNVVDFGADLTELVVELENRGTGDLLGDTFVFTPDVPWLTASFADVVAGDGIDVDRMTLDVDRAGLPSGVQQTVVTLNYLNGGAPVSTDIVVRLQVGQATLPADTVFVLLLDPDTFATILQTETTRDADFGFAFGQVPAGTYLLVAGTDRDDDGLLGDEGELFGAFPSLDSPLSITVVGGQNPPSVEFSLQELATVATLGIGAGDEVRTFRRLR
ncbi:MAG: S8 family serine peptidase [Planctomycetes bacterium]|nr:S8 family serine peptidase [Planctomycetota bacterium]